MNAPLRSAHDPSIATLRGLDEIVRDLRAARERWRLAQQRPLETGGREFPSREALRDIVERLCGALFPMRLGPPDLQQGHSEDFHVGHTLDTALRSLFDQVRPELTHIARHDPLTGPVTIERYASRSCSSSLPPCPEFVFSSTATSRLPTAAIRRRAASTR